MKKGRLRFAPLIMAAAIMAGVVTFAPATPAYAVTRQAAVDWVYAQMGKPLDYDGSDGAQCVDLTKAYYAFMGHSQPIAHAYQYVNNNTNIRPAGWTFHNFSDVSGALQPGDILIKNAGSHGAGSYGHVGIYLYWNSSTGRLVVANQRWAGKNYVHTIEDNRWNYVLRPAFDAPGPVAEPLPTASANIENDIYAIKTTSGKYVVAQANPANGGNVFIYQGNDVESRLSDEFRWKLTAHGDQTYRLENVLRAGMALDVDAGNVGDGSNISVFPTHDKSNQRWFIIDAGGGWYEFVSQFSGRAMDVASGASADGTNIQQYKRNQTDAQRFQLVPLTPANTYQKQYYDGTGHQYQVFDENLTWSHARTKAEALGGYLATATSAGEMDFIQGMLQPQRRNQYWLGATDGAAEGSWSWATGEPFEYTKWDQTQPDNAGGVEDYLCFRSATGAWNDLPDNTSQRSLGYVVEWDLEQSAPAAPVMESRTTTSITLSAIPGAEYRRALTGSELDFVMTPLADSIMDRLFHTAPQDSPEFLGLTPGADYTFSARMKAKDGYQASAWSAGTVISTDSEGAATDPLPTEPVPQTQNAPGAPTVAAKTSSSITLNTIAGAEYKLGADGQWQDSPVFSGLAPNTGYAFYARLKGGDNVLASPDSPASEIITTDAEAVTPPPSGGNVTNPGGNGNPSAGSPSGGSPNSGSPSGGNPSGGSPSGGSPAATTGNETVAVGDKPAPAAPADTDESNESSESDESNEPEVSLELPGVQPRARSFEDVPRAHWAYEYIRELARNLIVDGYPAESGGFTYQPEGGITRAEIVKLIVASLALPLEDGFDGSAFADWAKVDDWAKPYVGAAVKAGIVNGSIEDGGLMINGSSAITRQEMIAMAVRALGLDAAESGSGSAAASAPPAITDFDTADEWALETLAFALTNGMINADDGLSRPQDNATRAEAAMTLYKALEYKFMLRV